MDDRPSPNVLRSDQIPPALHPDDLNRSLAAANPHTIILPSLPHLPRHPKHTPRRANTRPSTARSAQDKHNRLPPLPSSMGDLSPTAYSSLSDRDSSTPEAIPKSALPDVRLPSHPQLHHQLHSSSAPAPCDDASIQEMNRKAHAVVADFRAEASRLSGLGTFMFPRPTRSLPAQSG
ncbi:hypothetical protein BD414DRAFT_405714 [Trametes punicea]|nr:hypothetical protein BD414DRAFT_405714 [Trametes punicea]